MYVAAQRNFKELFVEFVKFLEPLIRTIKNNESGYTLHGRKFNTSGLYGI